MPALRDYLNGPVAPIALIVGGLIAYTLLSSVLSTAIQVAALAAGAAILYPSHVPHPFQQYVPRQLVTSAARYKTVGTIVLGLAAVYTLTSTSGIIFLIATVAGVIYLKKNPAAKNHFEQSVHNGLQHGFQGEGFPNGIPQTADDFRKWASVLQN